MTKARAAFAVAILLAIALPLTMVAQSEASPAQPQGQMGEHHDHMGRMGGHMDDLQIHLDHMSKMLNLTDDQKAKILPILQDTHTQSQSLRGDTSLSLEERRAKMRDLHQKSMAQVRGLLTAEQQAKMDEMKKHHEGMGRGKGMGHGTGMGPHGDGQQPPPPPQ